jgi:hypothetical protein
MMAVLKAYENSSGGGSWVEGAPTHLFADLLSQLEKDGWLLLKSDRKESLAASVPGYANGGNLADDRKIASFDHGPHADAIIAALRILQDRTIGSPEACQRAVDVLVAGLASRGAALPAHVTTAHTVSERDGEIVVEPPIRAVDPGCGLCGGTGHVARFGACPECEVRQEDAAALPEGITEEQPSHERLPGGDIYIKQGAEREAFSLATSEAAEKFDERDDEMSWVWMSAKLFFARPALLEADAEELAPPPTTPQEDK